MLWGCEIVVCDEKANLSLFEIVSLCVMIRNKTQIRPDLASRDESCTAHSIPVVVAERG